MGYTGTRQFVGGLGSLRYNMMKWHNPILAPDSLWLVWADTDMFVNVDILTLTPDSLWAVRADTSRLHTMGIGE